LKFPRQSEKFSEENYADLVNALNIAMSRITLEDNLNGQIIENITIPPGETITIPHSLGRVPLYKIILRQVGAAIITDEGQWTDSYIQLKSNSGADFKLTEEERTGVPTGLRIFFERAETPPEAVLSIVLL